MAEYKYKNNLSPEHERLVWENREKPARELARMTGAKLWHVRYFLYSKGFKKMEVELWTDEQVHFLRENFREIGDKEIAGIFEHRWPKNKTWTLKHIEKKRNYLNLHRTKEELKEIRERNRQSGSYRTGKTWQARGVSEIGATSEWPDQSGRLRKHVKVEKGFVPMAPLVWEKHNGPIPEGHMIRFIDGDPLNCTVGNMELVSNAENGRRNAIIASQGLSDNYVVSISTIKEKHLRKEIKQHPELVELIRGSILLKREIKKQKEQNI